MTNQQEIQVEEGTVVRLKVDGDLQVHGQEGALVRADGADELPSIEQANGTLRVECRGDCVVHVPLWAQVEIETNGDLLVDGLRGGVAIVFCGGNATLSGAGGVDIKEMGGDLQASQLASINARKIHGDAHLSDVRGQISLDARGDAYIHQVTGSVSVNAKGNARLAEVTGEKIQVNAKGDTHLLRCQADIAINTAGDVHLNEIVSQRVRAVAKGDVRVHFSEKIGGQAKIVTGGDLIVRGEKSVRKGKGVYSFRFGQGDAVLAFVSKGDTILEGVNFTDGSLRSVGDDMRNLGVELGEMGEGLGEELGAMGAEMGREFGNLGRDIARQVQEKVARKMREMGKRTAKVEWGEGKSWNFNFGDVATPPKPPTPPTPPAWNAPFDPVEEVTVGEPVSDEERGLVLRMLEEGKISAAEAATLLEALGDAE